MFASKYYLLFIGFLLAFASCKDHGTTTVDTKEITDSLKKPLFVKETATSGKIRVGIDETLKPIAIQIVEAFSANYPDATLETVVLPEATMYKYLAEDSLRIAIGTRELSDQEKKRILAEKIKPKDYIIAHSAVVMLVNAANPTQQLDNEQLTSILSGETTTWKQVDPEGLEKEINIVFDHPESSVLRQLDQTYLKGKPLSSRAFATRSSLEVVDYVSKTKGALGLIGFSWVSDKDDPMTSDLLDSVNVVALQASDSSEWAGEFFRPYQTEISLKQYPLTRTIRIVSREYFTGLGTGFAIYATAEQGQRIALKAGLLPEHMPPRLIKLPPKE